MLRPNFSIIIPSYNRVETLARALRSVVRQSMDDWELIIVDDGSIDNTKDIIREFLTDERIKYYYQEHRGVSSARNFGLIKAEGDYIIFLDSDDEFSEGLLERLTLIKYKEYDLVFWYTKKILGKKTQIWKPRKLEKIYNNIIASFLSGSVCYKRSILQKVGGFDEDLNFGENYELGIRLSQLKKLKTVILPEVHLIYHVNPGVRPNSMPAVKLKSLKYLLKKHKDKYESDKYSYSRLLYQMGYLNEKLGRNDKALMKFIEASKVDSMYVKPLIKKFILKFKWI